MSGSTTAFICTGRPPTWNKALTARGQKFLEDVSAGFWAAGGERRDGPLYGIIYWFVRGYNGDHDPDADNISKRVWDKLGESGAYNDDKQVRLRIAGIVNLSPVAGANGVEVEVLDLSSAPPSVADAVETLIFDDDASGATSKRASGFVYLEIGRLRHDMLRFNLASAAPVTRDGGAGGPH